MSKRTPRRQTSRERKARSNRNTFIALGVAIVLALVALIWYDSRSNTVPSVIQGRVEVYASEGTAHIPLGERATYRTDPPNSGPHWARWAPPGFYDQRIDDELLVHNLEHGHVIIFYRPDSLTSEDESYLSTLVRSYTGDWDAVLAVPREGMDHPYVLSAWRHLLRLDHLERPAVEAFIDAYRGRGPENPVR